MTSLSKEDTRLKRTKSDIHNSSRPMRGGLAKSSRMASRVAPCKPYMVRAKQLLTGSCTRATDRNRRRELSTKALVSSPGCR